MSSNRLTHHKAFDLHAYLVRKEDQTLCDGANQIDKAAETASPSKPGDPDKPKGQKAGPLKGTSRKPIGGKAA